nr:delta(3,5)-delta(2,4)-dienoyl-CoA isomerase, peroxisomal [Tanacetum cinerariifolium]
MSSSSYTSLEIIQEDTNNPSVFTLHLNRPTRHNALSLAFFSEFPRALSSLDQNPKVSVIILSGRGKHFCAGINLAALNSISSDDVPSDRGRSGVASRSRLAVIGMKNVLLKSREMSVQQGFDYVTTWNSFMLCQTT